MVLVRQNGQLIIAQRGAPLKARILFSAPSETHPLRVCFLLGAEKRLRKGLRCSEVRARRVGVRRKVSYASFTTRRRFGNNVAKMLFSINQTKYCAPLKARILFTITQIHSHRKSYIGYVFTFIYLIICEKIVVFKYCIYFSLGL